MFRRASRRCYGTLGKKKAEMKNMVHYGNGRVRMEFEIPSRGLLGFRGQFLTDTRGTGIATFNFMGISHIKAILLCVPKVRLVSMETGAVTGFALIHLQQRGMLFIEPGEKVYEGMIIGENSREDDMDANPCKQKKLTNMRASGTDEAIKFEPPRIMEFETAWNGLCLMNLLKLHLIIFVFAKKFLKLP